MEYAEIRINVTFTLLYGGDLERWKTHKLTFSKHINTNMS